MTSEQDNNKRIAKNTVYLYFRMFITMMIGLYTSRVVLNTLGVSDYGVFNVMGGVIGMLTYINQLLAGASSRFLTIDIGKGDFVLLKKTFTMLNSLTLLSIIIIFILGETIGLWFVNTQLNIDMERMEAANWVYQCALICCFLAIFQNSFVASLIAHEEMDIFAYMSIFDVMMKLLVVWGLTLMEYDKLKLYSILTLLVSIISSAIYILVCMRKFQECRLSFSFDRNRFREMINYSGWNMVGAFAGVLNNYGLNILLNIFFNTVVNAARGIAFQVSNIVRQFSANFQTASTPQIMKYFAENDISGMSRLICNTSKYSAFLLLCLIIPIVYNIDFFLMAWLGQKPEYTSWFVRVMLIQIIFEAIDLPVGVGIHAIGRMKLPNLTSAFIYLSVFPLSYLFFKLGANPILGYCVYMVSNPSALIVDLMILKKYSGFSPSLFVKTVLFPILLVVAISNILSLMVFCVFDEDGYLCFVIRCLLCFVSVCIPVYCWGISNTMKKALLSKTRNKTRQLFKGIM